MMHSIFAKIPDLDAYLKSARETYGRTADSYPQIDKMILVANHLFRLLPMVSLMRTLPFSPIKNYSIMLGGSGLYAITVERFCQLRFTVLACFGAIAFNFAEAHGFKLKYSLPLTFYGISVIKAVYFPQKSCCKKN